MTEEALRVCSEGFENLKFILEEGTNIPIFDTCKKIVDAFFPDQPLSVIQFWTPTSQLQSEDLSIYELFWSFAHKGFDAP